MHYISRIISYIVCIVYCLIYYDILDIWYITHSRFTLQIIDDYSIPSTDEASHRLQERTNASREQAYLHCCWKKHLCPNLMRSKSRINRAFGAVHQASVWMANKVGKAFGGGAAKPNKAWMVVHTYFTRWQAPFELKSMLSYLWGFFKKIHKVYKCYEHKESRNDSLRKW